MTQFHTIKPGDTLESISEAYYRSPEFDNYIYDHNLHTIQNPNYLPVGQTLIIPYIPLPKRFMAMMDED